MNTDSIHPGYLFCISAPSGAGKTSLIAEVLSQNALRAEPFDLKLSVSYTTRLPRSGEQSGREYNFVSDAVFDEKIRHLDFLEYATVFNNRYGTSKQWVEAALNQGSSVLLEIDWQGAFRIRELFPSSQVVLIYILPPSLEVLEARLKHRGKDSVQQLALRMQAAKQEISHCIQYDYMIINHDFEQAISDLGAILTSYFFKKDYQMQQHHHVIKNLISQ